MDNGVSDGVKELPYDRWTLQDLKIELRKRNKKVSGKKKELIDR